MTKHGRLPDPALINNIINLASPTDLKGIQSLLGLAQVAREYIPNLTLLNPEVGEERSEHTK
jgi:hypothetical protein